MVQWMRTDHVDREALGSVIASVFAWALNHSVEVRGRPLGARFVDVHFDHLLRDPVAAVAQAYAHMGRTFAPEHGERIRAYLRDKPRGKFGTHQYAPEDWGFTAASLREQLAPYVAHFDVALEES
jgi:hypothetical protein